MKNIFLIIGTRPDAIKMAPVIKALSGYPEINPITVATAQHREMLDQVLSAFELNIQYDLDIMKPNQSLDEITINSLKHLGKLIDKEKPAMIVVQGDTTSSFIAGLAGFYRKIPIAHVEAGLRTNNLFKPFPEEANRRLLDAICELLFPPTEQAMKNLLKEGIPAERCTITGNTAIDALLWIKARSPQVADPKITNALDNGKKIILITAHRRESFGKPFLEFIDAIHTLAQIRSDICIVYPVHLNPNVNNPVRERLSNIENILLPSPMPYTDFVALMMHSYLILTDSGGIQEEAPVLGKPVLVLRDITERPEGVQAGAAKIIGMNKDKIINETIRLLDDEKEYSKMAQVRYIYGDGKASERIANKVLEYLW